MVLEQAMKHAAEVLSSTSHVVIASHVDPDGDAVGSTLGLAHALDRLGITTALALGSGERCPTTYAFLPGADRLAAPVQPSEPYVLAALDCPDLRRLADAAFLAEGAEAVVLIDHHPDAVAGPHTAVFDSSAAATGVLVWRMLPFLGVEPDDEIATCLYTAVLTDTGRFSYANTTADTLRLAAEIVGAGAHPHDIYTAVYENRSAGAQQLVGRTLARVTLANEGHVAYSWITPEDFDETGARPEEAENLIDYVRALGGVDVVFLAKVNGSTVRGNLRSKADIDVSAIARELGGGGHRAAAGFTVEGDLPALLDRLLPMLPGGAR